MLRANSRVRSESEEGVSENDELPILVAKPSKKEAGKTIEIPAMKINELHLRLVGLSPLIVHAWSEKNKRMMADKQAKKATSKKDAKNPKEEFESARYKMPGGKDGFPPGAIRKAIITAGSFVEGVFKTHIRGALFVNLGEDLVPIESDKPIMREDVVRIGGMTKTADLRYRPEYRNWSIPIVIRYNASILSAEQIVNLIKMAGMSVGIGEWRPQRDGQFGMFDVVADNSSPRKRK